MMIRGIRRAATRIPVTIQFERAAPHLPAWMVQLSLGVTHKMQALFGVVHGVCGVPVVRFVNPRVDRAAIGRECYAVAV